MASWSLLSLPSSPPTPRPCFSSKAKSLVLCIRTCGGGCAFPVLGSQGTNEQGLLAVHLLKATWALWLLGLACPGDRALGIS